MAQYRRFRREIIHAASSLEAQSANPNLIEDFS